MSETLSRTLGAGDPSIVASDGGNVVHTAELRAESVDMVADPSAAIDLLYMNYLGRHPTATELLTLSTQIVNGARTLDTARADLVASPAAQSFLSTQITTLYQTWGGRSATNTEVAVWTNEMTLHGATLTTVRTAILTDPLGQAYTAGLITQAYQTWGGRAPTASELAVWQGQFLGGIATPATVTTAIQNDPLGVTYINGLVTQAYQQWGGRAPTASELATWHDTIAYHGGTIDTVKQTILGDALGINYLNGIITQAYQQWGGRAPTTAELATWRDTIATHGGSADTVKQTILGDTLGVTYLNGVITQAYQQWGGRAPTTAELAIWRDTIAYHGGTADSLKQTILADSLGTNYASAQLATLFSSHGWGAATQADVTALVAQLQSGMSFTAAAATIPHHNTIDPAVLTHIYEGFSAFLGRAPTSIEAGNWTATVQADGTGLATLRTTVLASGEGQTYITAQVTAAYQQLAGRAPTTSEIATWQDAIANQGSSFDAMRHAIVDTTDGQALASSSITGLFNAYLGRDPTTAETQTELAGLTQQGRTIEGIGAEVFTSTEGVVHFNDELALLFPQLLGHQASQQESSDWFNALYLGATYDTMRATLMMDPTSSAQQYIGTTGNDQFALGANPGDVVVSAFDAVNDRIVLGTRFASTNLLDAAHATQVLSLDDETPNVLIHLDANNTLLLHGVTLAQLSTADFLFA